MECIKTMKKLFKKVCNKSRKEIGETVGKKRTKGTRRESMEER